MAEGGSRNGQPAHGRALSRPLAPCGPFPLKAAIMRVLVCGTNYGRFYLEAIRLDRADFRLAGILARGSVRSQLTALEYGVPLFRGVTEVDRDVDLSCAAMGASG